MDLSKKEHVLSEKLVDIFFKVHRAYGPGLFESAYEEMICYELRKHNIPYERQKSVPLIYEDVKLEVGYRADIIVDKSVIIEIKSIDAIASIHYKQLLTYLRLADLRLGLLVNFNMSLIKDGIHRVANNL